MGDSIITTAQLAARTAGGDDYIRTKGGIVKGLALKPKLNEWAPSIVVVGDGPRIRARAELFLHASRVNPSFCVPTYLKQGTDAWTLVGNYRATAYLTSEPDIERYRGSRPPERIAGILLLDRTDEITDVRVRGGGFGDPETRRAVELASVAHVRTHYEQQGYTVESHEAQNLGYDLLATKGRTSLRLEVKGTGGDVERFFLTRNELKCGRQNQNWRLVIVTNALGVPMLSNALRIDEVEQRFSLDALAWECLPKA